jgi:aspartate racemase
MVIGRIGIIGGSAPGAALCFQTLCTAAGEYLGPDAHPEIAMHILSFAEHVRYVRAGDWDGLGVMLLKSAARLQAAGSDFLICPDNTAHLAFERIASRLPLPWLHIADAVAEEGVRGHYQRIGVLGTRPLVASGLYERRLVQRGIASINPNSDELDRLDSLIFGELARGVVSEGGRSLLRLVTKRLRDEERCDAVALVCTELPLLLDSTEALTLPTLDSTRLLAGAAIRRAVEGSTGGRPSARRTGK